MKKQNVTFSIPKETIDLLQRLIGRRKLSSFVTQAIHSALKEKEEALRNAYIQANKDPDRAEVIKDWSAIEGESWDDD